MARIVPVIAVSRSLMERLMKSSVGKVQRRTWVRDSTGRKGHYRMQWVDPDHDKAGEGKDQIDLFSESEKKPEAYKPHWPEKGTFAGNGLGDNGREYEGYYEGKGPTRFYDTETGREIGESGEFIDEKKPTAEPIQYESAADIYSPKVKNTSLFSSILNRQGYSEKDFSPEKARLESFEKHGEKRYRLIAESFKKDMSDPRNHGAYIQPVNEVYVELTEAQYADLKRQSSESMKKSILYSFSDSLAKAFKGGK